MTYVANYRQLAVFHRKKCIFTQRSKQANWRLVVDRRTKEKQMKDTGKGMRDGAVVNKLDMKASGVTHDYTSM